MRAEERHILPQETPPPFLYALAHLCPTTTAPILVQWSDVLAANTPTLAFLEEAPVLQLGLQFTPKPPRNPNQLERSILFLCHSK